MTPANIDKAAKIVDVRAVKPGSPGAESGKRVRARRSRKSAISLLGTRNVNGCGIALLEFILTFAADPQSRRPEVKRMRPIDPLSLKAIVAHADTLQHSGRRRGWTHRGAQRWPVRHRGDHSRARLPHTGASRHPLRGGLLHALMSSAPRLLPWLLSLLTLGIFWLGQQTQLNQLERSNRDLTWLHFVFLAVVTALPFSARLLADFLSYRTAFLVYWLNIVLLGAALYAMSAYAEWAKLIREEAQGDISRAVKRRIVLAQSLYAIGALAGLVNVTLGITLIMLIQLTYAMGRGCPSSRVFDASKAGVNCEIVIARSHRASKDALLPDRLWRRGDPGAVARHVSWIASLARNDDRGSTQVQFALILERQSRILLGDHGCSVLRSQEVIEFAELDPGLKRVVVGKECGGFVSHHEKRSDAQTRRSAISE